MKSETRTLLAERLREAAKLAGGIDVLAQKAAVPRRTLETYLSGEAEPKVLRLAAIARSAGVSITWLATGEGPMSPAAAAEAAGRDRGMAEEVRPFPEGGEARLIVGEALRGTDGEMVRVPVYPLKLSAGAGAPAWAAEQPVEYVDLPASWLHGYLRVEPRHAVAFPVEGDSMEPTLPDGGLAILDVSVHEVARDAIYALRRGEDLFVKRVVRAIDGAVSIRTDNPAHADTAERLAREAFAQIDVLGRVAGALKRV